MKPFLFHQRALDPATLVRALENPVAGGYASFEGWVRNHNEGHAVTRLEYETFEALACKEGERIVAEAVRRFGIIKATCAHRVGSLAIGELAVWVGVSSRHRAEAFEACRYIIDEVKHRVPIWKKEYYATGDSGWVNCERCAIHGRDHDHDDGKQTLVPDYSRQIALREVGAAGQDKLRRARVLVVGAGGLGVPVLTYLAGAGVGTLGIADADVVSASNLHRQTIYALADAGALKAPLAAQRLQALNPTVRVEVHAERIDTRNAARLIDAYDLIVECSDNFATKFLVNDAAVSARKPVVFASVYQYEGQLQVYRAELDSSCLRCLWPDATRDGLVGNCTEAGVLGPVPGVLGSLQALEALKLILALPGQLRNEMLLIDLLALNQRRLRTSRRMDCNHEAGIFAPAPMFEDLELDFVTLQPALQAGYTILDIRETQEVMAAPIAAVPSMHIALAGILADSTLDSLDSEHPYLLVCARGVRSRAAAEHLRGKGFRQACSLRGGLAALDV